METDIVQILDESGIKARVKRMAYEIYESNYTADKIFLIGIDERGGFLAEMLTNTLQEICSKEICLVKAELDRDAEGMGITLSEKVEELSGQPVIVVDDVLYSGTTMLHVMSILLQVGPSSIQTAVLIDRGHRKMPVSSDFVGVELATTLQQHVYFEMGAEDREMRAYIA